MCEYDVSPVFELVRVKRFTTTDRPPCVVRDLLSQNNLLRELFLVELKLPASNAVSRLQFPTIRVDVSAELSNSFVLVTENVAGR